MRVRDKTRDLFVELMIQFWGSEAGSNFLAQDFKGRNDATILLQSHFVPPRPTQSNHHSSSSLSVFFSLTSLRVLFSLDSFDQENRSAAAAGQCRPTRTAQNKKIGSLNVTMALRLVTSRVAASASSRSLAVAVRSTNGAFVWWKLSCVGFFFCTSRAQFPDLLSVMSSSSAFSSPSHHQFP